MTKKCSPQRVTINVSFKHGAFSRRNSPPSFGDQSKSSVHHDSLRVLESDKLYDLPPSLMLPSAAKPPKQQPHRKLS
ncbi:hypothetical protein TIFTF001_031329 [Ficus carica]|uniref:Uncharacterized protein n=1 Tax=Ficus carica TaxID=3494 RepID=A0AA88DVA2_FICCA|nr:hypothetical protein TIFTF001_031329 [Ficus carica]